MNSIRLAFALLSIVATNSLPAQALYTPGGTVGNNTVNSNVGIGLSNPQYKLDVAGQMSAHWTGDALLATGSGGWVGLYLQNDNYSAGTYNRVVTDSIGGLTINHNGNDVFYVARSGTSDAWFAGNVDSNGQIRIRQKLFGGFAGLLIQGNTPSSNWPNLGFSMVNVASHDVEMACVGTQIVSNITGAEAMDLYFSTGRAGTMTEAMRISSTGNIGIGTPAPNEILHLQRDGGNAGVNLMIENIGTGADYRNGIAGIVFGKFDGVQTRHQSIYYKLTGSTWADSRTTITSFLSSGATDDTINITGGKVGIGTTNPGTYKLAVAGSVHAQEVVVDMTGWSDYVFDEHYKLAPLSEVESHIKAEKHLPGIPSASEVAAQGISVGEMQAKLLAKIEELTLHQIEQEKRLAAQSAKLESQSMQLAAQFSRIERLEVENTELKNSR